MAEARTVERLARIAAWLLLVLIAVVTIGPIGIRPHTMVSVQVERLAAFVILGALFAIAYPRHVLLVAALVLGTAVLLELAQLLAPSRHGRVFDLAVKLGGGAIGLLLGWGVNKWRLRR